MLVTQKKKLVKPPAKSRVFNSSQGYRVVGGRKIYFRSAWEVNYAIFLEWLKQKKQIQEWEYEPMTFWFEKIKRGVRSYKPYFRVLRLDGSHYWVEVKGYMDSKSVTKIKRLKKYYPDEQLQVVEKKWFQEHRRKLPILCEAWENDYTEGMPE